MVITYLYSVDSYDYSHYNSFSGSPYILKWHYEVTVTEVSDKSSVRNGIFSLVLN